MQGAGTLLCALVLVTLTSTMGDDYDSQWRLALLLGAAPMVVAFYFRYCTRHGDFLFIGQSLQVSNGITGSSFSSDGRCMKLRGGVRSRGWCR